MQEKKPYTIVKATDLKEGDVCLGYATRYDADTVTEHVTGRFHVISNRLCSVAEYERWGIDWRSATFIRWSANELGEYEGHATYADLTDLYLLETSEARAERERTWEAICSSWSQVTA